MSNPPAQPDARPPPAEVAPFDRRRLRGLSSVGRERRRLQALLQNSRDGINFASFLTGEPGAAVGLQRALSNVRPPLVELMGCADLNTLLENDASAWQPDYPPACGPKSFQAPAAGSA
jgi:hypothetical protein